MLTGIPLVIALSAVALACASSEGSSGGGALPRANAEIIETILKEDGHYSEALESQLTIVVNSREEFAALWERVFTGSSPVPELPEVDFSDHTVVLATPGMKATGGHGVTIESLEEIPEGMRLVITAFSPGATCMTTQALTTPVHIVKTPKLPGVVLFEWREKVVECE